MEQLSIYGGHMASPPRSMGSKVSCNVLGLFLALLNVFLALKGLHEGHIISISSSIFSLSDEFTTFLKWTQPLLPPLISLIVSATAVLSPDFVAGKPNSAKLLVPLAVFLIINVYTASTMLNLYYMKPSRKISDIINYTIVSSLLFAVASLVYIVDDSDDSCWKALKPWKLEEEEAEDLYENVYPGEALRPAPFQLPCHTANPVYPPVYPSNPSRAYPTVY